MLNKAEVAQYSFQDGNRDSPAIIFTEVAPKDDKAVQADLKNAIVDLSLTDTIQDNTVEWITRPFKFRPNARELDRCIEWFLDLQNNCVASRGHLRINVLWVPSSTRKNPSSIIARFDSVRKSFLCALQRSNDVNIIEDFIRTHAFIQLQMKFDTSLREKTKGDGLCFLRSLKQLKDTASHNFFERGKRKRYQSDVWTDVDVKLEIDSSRNEFIQFLSNLIEALKLITYEKLNKDEEFLSEKHFILLKQRWINILISTLYQLKNFIGDWESFILGKDLWIGWFVAKCIPHAFSKIFPKFPGSYFCSNRDDLSRHYDGADELNQFAFLICSFGHPTTDLLYPDPLSLQFENIIQVLTENKIVFLDSHYFAIRQKNNETNMKCLDLCVKSLAKMIHEVISCGNVPTLPF